MCDTLLYHARPWPRGSDGDALDTYPQTLVSQRRGLPESVRINDLLKTCRRKKGEMKDSGKWGTPVQIAYEVSQSRERLMCLHQRLARNTPLVFVVSAIDQAVYPWCRGLRVVFNTAVHVPYHGHRTCRLTPRVSPYKTWSVTRRKKNMRQ